MRNYLISVIITLGIFMTLLFGARGPIFPQETVYAAEPSGITVDGEFKIPDDTGHTYYVIVATNNCGEDVSVGASFAAADSKGEILSKVRDEVEAVKAGQQFMVYGQFKTAEVVNAAGFLYSFNTSKTGRCSYSDIAIETLDNGSFVEVRATNNSINDLGGVGVRTLFMKDGKAVGFDTVNIADVGYTFRRGSTNKQSVGGRTDAYDQYILTYTSAGKDPLMKKF